MKPTRLSLARGMSAIWQMLNGHVAGHFIRPVCVTWLTVFLLMRSPPCLAGGWSWLDRQTTSQTPQTPNPAVARIVTQDADGTSLGSGSLVDTQDQFGLIVTNWHVVRDAVGAIDVVFPNGFRSSARLLKIDQDWDLAALLIWRPRVPPLRIANRAPLPGDVLTIAGYGPGSYRAVSGRCTQYLAPSDHHPFEIVELSAAARQGDSGGPILNTRGELAGVLFGSDGGTTSGSYAGRVRQFLATAWPPSANTGPAAGRALLAPATVPARGEHARGEAHRSDLPASGIQELAPLPRGSGLPPSTGLQPLPSELTGGKAIAAPLRAPPARPALDLAKSSGDWLAVGQALLGRSITEQLKTILAGIGLLTVLVHLTRWFSPSKT